METFDLRHCGFWFTIVGMFVSGGSLYASWYINWICVMEFVPGMLTSIMGLYLLGLFKKTNRKSHSRVVNGGRESPFYYELEPSPTQRSLPPIPKDIGRDYDPIVLDKV